ncbi:MAG: sodium:proton antiporter [Desulfuromonadales bacterium]|nr:sodium:proton antiporter [Desulfuromonadales bacterium]
MGMFDVLTILMVLTAVFSYINYRTLKLPTTIGVMGVSLLVSLGIAGMEMFGISSPQHRAERIFSYIDFDKALLHGMLAFLLFAGSLQIKFSDLTRQKYVVTLLSTVGVIVSTFIVGGLTWLVLRTFGMPMRLIHCLLLGALISPTDPVAVLAILKSSGVPKSVETKIAGESLFNDGIGVVAFMIILELAGGTGEVTVGKVMELVIREAVGGVVFGLVLGLLAYQLLKRVDDYQLAVIITLALVMGGYSLADSLHTSGPLAIVAAGLLVGNQGRAFAMSDSTRERLDTFWNLVGAILSAILFMLIGMEVQFMELSRGYVIAGLAAIVIALLGRWASVAVSVSIMRPFRHFSPGIISMLTWGGLRGGVSVALALSLPHWKARNAILAMTYMVVVFSILVQGLTLGKLARWFYPDGHERDDA